MIIVNVDLNQAFNFDRYDSIKLDRIDKLWTISLIKILPKQLVSISVLSPCTKDNAVKMLSAIYKGICDNKDIVRIHGDLETDTE